MLTTRTSMRWIEGFQNATFISDAAAFVIFGTLFLILVGILVHWYFFNRA